MGRRVPALAVIIQIQRTSNDFLDWLNDCLRMSQNTRLPNLGIPDFLELSIWDSRSRIAQTV